MAPEKPEKPIALVGSAVIAEACNLGERRVQQLADKGIIPRKSKGKYELMAVLRAYIRYLQQAMSSKGSMDEDGEVTTTKDQRIQLLAAQTEREVLEVARLKGDVMDIADHESILSTLVIDTKARIMAVAPRAAPVLAPETNRLMTQAILEKYLREAMEPLSKLLPAMPRVEDPPAEPKPPKKPKQPKKKQALPPS